MTVSQQLVLISATISKLSTLIKVAKEKIKKIETGSRSATMNFRLIPISRRKETEPKGKSGTRKFLTKS